LIRCHTVSCDVKWYQMSCDNLQICEAIIWMSYGIMWCRMISNVLWWSTNLQIYHMDKSVWRYGHRHMKHMDVRTKAVYSHTNVGKFESLFCGWLWNTVMYNFCLQTLADLWSYGIFNLEFKLFTIKKKMSGKISGDSSVWNMVMMITMMCTWVALLSETKKTLIILSDQIGLNQSPNWSH